MSKILDKAAADVRAKLSAGETVLAEGSGQAGINPAAIVLTSRRLILYTTFGRFGKLKFSEVALDAVLEAHYNAAMMGPDHHTLLVTSRQGDFRISFGLGRYAREEGPRWPGLILQAQTRPAPQPARTPAQPGPANLAEQLQSLDKLRSSGGLSDEEFAAAKRKLLD